MKSKKYTNATEEFDYIFNADVSSLYPASMCYHLCPIGNFKQSSGYFDKLLLGIYQVRYKTKAIFYRGAYKNRYERLEWDVWMEKK